MKKVFAVMIECDPIAEDLHGEKLSFVTIEKAILETHIGIWGVLVIENAVVRPTDFGKIKSEQK